MVWRLIGAVLALLGTDSALLAAGPGVVVSISPLRGLVAGVMAGVGEPHLLVPPNASEHAYALRPSDARALADADVVVWIGPGYERFLDKTVAASSARIITIYKELRIVLLPAREGDSWDAHDHEHDEAEYDGHLWLDPMNAQAIVAIVADALSEIDPANASQYRANSADLTNRLSKLDTRLAATLRPIADRPFIVFHDAYQYLEHRYGLSAVGSILVDPDRPPSAGRMVELRRKVRDLEAVCVFAEPQFDAGLVATLVEGTNARTGTLDHLGGADYQETMIGLAAALVACLAP